MVAQDLFINESGAFADVFLPAVSWAEKEGTFTNTDRRVQRVRRALEPRGQSRADWEIICQLAQRIEKRLGRQQTAFWGYESPAEVLEEMGRLVPEYAGVKYQRIEKQGLQTPVWDDKHPGTPYLFADTFPSGRGKFHPLEYVPAVEMPDDEYPFILTTGRLLEHWHGGTLTRHSKLDDLYPEARIEINPGDAARLNIEDGQVVRVSSRRGTIVLRTWVTQRATVGMVFVPMHFAEAAANLLTIDALDPLAKIPEYKACAVRIVPAATAELEKPEAKVSRGRY
jgi:predicted molibdopterin-dependent oxidoreductase YjgC